MSPEVNSFILGLASSLAYDLIKYGAQRLKQVAFGTTEQKALRLAYGHAFEIMLSELTLELDEVNQIHLSSLFEQFVREPEVAYLLLDLALTESDLPINELRTHFDEQGFDRETLPIDFDAATSSLVRGLTEGLQEEAIKPESPLYNRVSFGRLITLQILLEQNQRKWTEALSLLQKLEASLKQASPREINISGDFIGTLMLLGDHSVVQQSILQLPSDLRQFAEAVRAAVVKAQRAVGDDRYDASLRDYLRALQLYCARHPYLSLDKYLRKRRNSLGEVYVPLTARAGDEGEGERLINIAKRIREFGAGTSTTPLLVTGAPGAGKSTLLRDVASGAWNLSGDADAKRYIPMVVRLQTLALVEETVLDKKLLKAIGKAGDLILFEDPPERFIEEWSRRTGASWLFLLDGLDEVPASVRPELLRWLDNFVSTVETQRHHVVLTSRPTDNLDEELGGRFVTYSLLPFTPKQQREFALRWFDDSAEDFLREVDRAETDYLKGTPLLLTIAAIVYDSKRHLPERQAELYENFVDIWLSEANRRGLRQELGERLSGATRWVLEHLALVMTERPGDNSEDTLVRETANFLQTAFNLPQVEAKIEGDKFLEALGRHSGLLSADSKVYQWLHSTLREYMAARALARLLEDSNDDFATVLGERPFKGEWHEVCIYLAGVLQQPSKFIKWLSARALERNDVEVAILTRECWSKSKAADDEQSISSLIHALLVSLGDNQRPHVQREAIETLVWLGPRGAGELISLLEKITKHINDSRSAANSTGKRFEQ